MIEPQDPSHADGLYAALRDRRIYTFLDQEPPTSVEGVRERIERIGRGAPPGTGQTWLNWTVFDRGTVVGYTQATIDAGGVASLAYVLTPRVWGRSIAFAACDLTIAELEALPAVVEITADTEEGNARSHALLRRLGFQRTHQAGEDVFYRRPNRP
ncbi:GNAT family N-acetyltransferase [Roseicyclus sp. F158]|uniref:GNAT family N-acetyltransferase n=1 Tax=Tropicimonas omnivorans TaxID=3075590 RepID=A0ABU3DKE1_9RHOB|nr:GNAT family N-acetyltransferase [Roseicyclus sp. F158]MDT0684183.1 GNAT family N-acetyltransferase [Roseicyclus sp. F158]